MKKTLALTAAAALMLGLTACDASEDSNAGSPAAQAETSSAPAVEKAPSLDGTWKQTNSESEDSYQEATIEGDTITVNWISNNGDTKSLYWVGTFEAPATTAKTTITSQGDTEQMSTAMMASSSETKDFTYEDEELSYELTALGTTTTVRMEKQD